MDEHDMLHHLQRCGHYLYKRRGQRPAQIRILGMLRHHETMSQKDIQERLKIAQGSMSEILIKLEDKGLIERMKDPSDRRRSVLRLTEEGRKQAEEDAKRIDSENAGLFDVLSEEEKEQLDDMLIRLMNDWTGGEEC